MKLLEDNIEYFLSNIFFEEKFDTFDYSVKLRISINQNIPLRNFPGGPVVGSLPVNAEDTGRSYMPPEQLNPCSAIRAATAMRSLCTTTRE